MTGFLTTHVLDVARGRPAAGMAITLHRIDGAARLELARMTTNADGRTDAPILPRERFAPGVYELVFEVGAWLDEQGEGGAAPRFLETVPIRFGMSEASHYHVPLLVSPYGYSTYRGS
jgi:5-hydroxyisourate hydrolase